MFGIKSSHQEDPQVRDDSFRAQLVLPRCIPKEELLGKFVFDENLSRLGQTVDWTYSRDGRVSMVVGGGGFSQALKRGERLLVPFECIKNASQFILLSKSLGELATNEALIKETPELRKPAPQKPLPIRPASRLTPVKPTKPKKNPLPKQKKLKAITPTKPVPKLKSIKPTKSKHNPTRKLALKLAPKQKAMTLKKSTLKPKPKQDQKQRRNQRQKKKVLTTKRIKK